MDKHFLHHGRALHHTSVWCEIALKHRKTAGGGIRIVNRTNYLRISINCMRYIFPYRLTCYSHTVRMKEPLLIQLRHHRIDAARLVKILHIGWACRRKVTQVRCLLTDTICKINLKIHANLMGNGRKMEHTVGRAAKGHVYGQCIQNCLLCHNIPWTEVLLPQFHNLHACLLGKTDSGRVDCRNGSVSFKPHSQHLSQTVHAVGCVHT